MTALQGLQVLDLSRLAPGPYCTMLLADLGADVLVVTEPPGSGGRLSRDLPPHLEVDPAYNALERNKRSMTLNLKSDAGRAIFYQLAAAADIVVEGFRPGVVKRLGVDYDTLSRKNPRLVYCSISGYGQDGPYSPLVGHDLNYLALSGALSAISHPSPRPTSPLNLLGDMAGGGLFSAFAILAAIVARQRTGRGQYIDMAIADAVVSLLSGEATRFFANGEVPTTHRAPWHETYKTKDAEWISVASGEPYFFANLCRMLECEQFLPHQWDEAQWPAMYAAFEERFRTRTRQEWFDLLREADVCVAPVYNIGEVFSDAHFQHRRMAIDVEDGAGRRVRQIGIAPKFSETPGRVRTLKAELGAHTEEVLRSLGYDGDQLASLRQQGVVG